MPEVILSDYFYGDESEEFVFFKIPRQLITNPKFLLDDTPKTIEVKGSGTYNIELFNQPLGSLVIHKYSGADRKTPLAGVQFKVSYAPGCVVDKFVSELLGKETIQTQTSSQSKGRNGSYSQNFQQAGRELLLPDEVRMLDNRLAIVLVRGEAPVIDAKYDLMRHPNIKRTGDGGAAPYVHNARCLYDVGDLDFIFTSLDDIEIIEELEES